MTEAEPSPTSGRVGRPPATSRDEIAQAALRLATEEGLDAMTIRRLAAAMGRAPMTLYNYARTKEEIIDLMVAAAFESFRFEPDEQQPWQEQMHGALMGMYEMFRSHPVLIELLVGPRTITGPALDGVRERIFAVISRSGLPRQRSVDIFNTLGAYVIGVAAIEVGRARRRDELRAHLEGLPRDEFPGVAEDPEVWAHAIPRTMIEDGLRHLLDGLTADD